MWLKACPRCNGDLLLIAYSRYERAAECMQCGHTITLRHRPRLRHRDDERPSARALISSARR